MREARTLVELLRTRAEERASQTLYQFLRNGEEETAPITYGSLWAGACAGAALLRGLPRAARVILVFPSGPEFIQAFFGCLHAGCIPVALPQPRARGRGIEVIASVAKDCDAGAVLTSEALLTRIRPRLSEFPALQGLEWFTFEAAAGASINDQPPFDPDPSSTAFLQYTSGSTGNPKGVAVSHQNVLDNQRLLQLAFSHTSDTIIAGWLPHYHDMGLVGMLLHPVYLGSRCVLFSPEAFLQDPSRWLRAIARFRAHTSVAPTFAYELAADRIHALDPETDLSCWQVAIVGAEPVRRKTLHRFEEKFARWGFRRSAFYPCYGLAEATLFVTGGRWESDRGGSDHWTVECGPASGYQDVRIVVPHQRVPSAPGELGEIWVRGASVASGYWDRPSETDERFHAFLEDGTGPFLRTQDLGWMSRDGLIVAGRLRNIVILNGRNYFAEDIEAALYGCHPAAANGRAAAFAISDEHGEKLVVLQEIGPDAAKDLDVEAACQSIQKALGETLEITAGAIGLLRYGTIPRTTSGKVRYADCQRMFADGSLTARAIGTFERAAPSPSEAVSTADAPASRSRDSLEDWLVQRIARKLKLDPGAISRFDTFAALGLQSIDIIEITEELARALNVSLDPTLFWEFPSIADAALGLERAVSVQSLEDQQRTAP
ncbi:MAG TPA: AMP-binding protein [Bryobacteraceae bacterium]